MTPTSRPVSHPFTRHAKRPGGFLLTGPLAMAAILAALVAGGAWAQSFPSKPVTMLIGFAAGGNIDNSGRYLAQKLASRLGQPVIVENRAGASGQLAVQQLMVSPPDGHTIMFMSAGTTITSARRNAPFDVRRDITPISATAAGPLALYVNPGQPIHTVADLLRLARANPGKLNYTSPGVGSLQNLLFELLKQRTGIDMVHIPFKSAGESTAAVVAGRVEVGMDSMLLLKPQVEGGRLRFIAVTSAKASSGIPGRAESGVPDFDFLSWTGFGAPPRTAKSPVDTLNAAMSEAYREPDVKAYFSRIGQDMMGGSPEQFAQLLSREVDTWSKLIRSANIEFE